MRERWVDGAIPREDTVPLRRYDVYSLSDYVKLADDEDNERGRPFDNELDQVDDTPRNLLKVPVEELPDYFHMPCGEDPYHGNDFMTLAK